MKLLDYLIGTVAPHTCSGCGQEGSLLCAACVQRLIRVPSRCYRCYKLTVDSRTCRSCRSSTSLFGVQVGTTYQDMAKELIWRLKFTGAQAAARQMVDCLSATIPPGAFVTHVPTATSRVRQRGYDQAALLARELARKYKCRYLPCLARSGQQHQRGASRFLRLKQLSQAFRVTKPSLVKNAHIILIDDVLTTGATLQAAAHVLKEAGAKRVEAVVFAQA